MQLYLQRLDMVQAALSKGTNGWWHTPRRAVIMHDCVFRCGGRPDRLISRAAVAGSPGGDQEPALQLRGAALQLRGAGHPYKPPPASHPVHLPQPTPSGHPQLVTQSQWHLQHAIV